MQESHLVTVSWQVAQGEVQLVAPYGEHVVPEIR